MLLVELVQQNTQLTEAVHVLLEQVEALTLEAHQRIIPSRVE